MKRLPVVAGTFYPANPDELVSTIENCFLHPLGPGKLPKEVRRKSGIESLGFIVPHAGYRYSGPIAAHAYLRLAMQGPPRSIIIIGPNHSGYGSPVAVMAKGSWITPLGEVDVDQEIAFKLVRESTYLDVDEKAFLYEHSIEVQLPFIQYVYGEQTPRIVPIVVSIQHVDVINDLCNALTKLVSELREVLIVATSDWTHYEPYYEAVRKDRKALEFVEDLDYVGLLEYADKVNLTACGLSAVSIALCVARKLGISRATILAYATSGDVTGMKDSVVGYAAVEIPKP